MDRTFHCAREGGKCEAIDIDAELRRWQSDCFLTNTRSQQAFLCFEPTFKFAYDLYLKCHREPLDALSHRIENAYERSVPPAQRLDRETVQAIVAAVWERMGGLLSERRLPTSLVHSPERRAAQPPPPQMQP